VTVGSAASHAIQDVQVLLQKEVQEHTLQSRRLGLDIGHAIETGRAPLSLLMEAGMKAVQPPDAEPAEPPAPQPLRAAPGQPGNSIDLMIGREEGGAGSWQPCHGSFGEGGYNCHLPWKKNLTLHGVIHLEKGLWPGDALEITSQATIKMIPQKAGDPPQMLVETTVRCDICGDTCTISNRMSIGLDLNVTTPAVLPNPVACAELGDHPIYDLDLGNTSMRPLLEVPEQWEASGEFDILVQIVTSANTPRAATKIAFHVADANVKPKFASTRQTEGTKEKSAVSANVQNFLMTASEIFRKLNNTGVLKSLMRPNPQTKKVNSVSYRINVNNIRNNSGHNISFGDTCGSKGCKVPLGRHTVVSSAADLQTTFKEGTYFEMSIKPSFGGMLGILLKPYLHFQPIKLPVCGKPVELHIFNQIVTYNPPARRCGDYSIKLSVPQTQIGIDSIPRFSLKDLNMIPGVYMPDMKFNMEDLPAADLLVNLAVRDPDNSTVVDFDFEFQLGRA